MSEEPCGRQACAAHGVSRHTDGDRSRRWNVFLTSADSNRLGLVRQAAVLIALYQPPGADSLHVLLTTRASHMR